MIEMSIWLCLQLWHRIGVRKQVNETSICLLLINQVYCLHLFIETKVVALLWMCRKSVIPTILHHLRTLFEMIEHPGA